MYILPLNVLSLYFKEPIKTKYLSLLGIHFRLINKCFKTQKWKMLTAVAN